MNENTKPLENQPQPASKKTGFFNLLSILIVMVTGGVLIYGTLDMPAFGDPQAPANLHVAPRYINQIVEDTGVENMVTGILASYRGYDTLGETVVIFTAGLSVILLLRRASKDG